MNEDVTADTRERVGFRPAGGERPHPGDGLPPVRPHALADTARTLGAALALLWTPLSVTLAAIDLPEGGWVFSLLDLALLLLVVSWVANKLMARSPRRAELASGLLTLLMLAAIASASLAGQVTGWVVVLRGLGAIVLGATIAASHGERRAVILVAFVFTSATQSLIGIIQMVLGRPLGLQPYGELRRLFEVTEVATPTGTLLHPYWLAGLCCLAVGVTSATYFHRRRYPVALVAGLMCIPVGLSLSRAALLGIVPLLLLVAWRSIRLPRLLPLLAALIVGFGGSVAVTADSWLGRVDETLSPSHDLGGTGVGGRLMLAREGIALTRRNFWLGVGPGNYEAAAEKQLGPGYSGEISHTAPLLLAAELGAPAGAAFMLLILAAARRAIRGGVAPTCIFVSFLPFVALDAFSYSRPQGLVLTAVWLGTVWSWSPNGSAEDGVEDPASSRPQRMAT